MQLSPSFAKTSDPFENLANAIIVQAVLDYSKAFCRKIRKTESESDLATIKQVEIFFFSDWFHTLSSADPKMMLRRTKELAAMKNKHIRQKSNKKTKVC